MQFVAPAAGQRQAPLAPRELARHWGKQLTLVAALVRQAALFFAAAWLAGPTIVQEIPTPSVLVQAHGVAIGESSSLDRRRAATETAWARQDRAGALVQKIAYQPAGVAIEQE